MADPTPDFTLNGPVLEPKEGEKPKKLVLLVHGVGADGQDLIGLAPYFQEILPDAIFIAPNAPYRFDMAPFGYQWFSLRDFTYQERLEGTRGTAPILNDFIDELLAHFNLTEENMALIGFSQGTMMSLWVGLRRQKQLAGILGYSGMLIGADLLADEMTTKPPVRLIHGEDDEVLPVASLPEAIRGLEAAGIEVEGFTRPGLGHGIDEEGIRLGQEFLAEIFGVEDE